MIRVDPPILMRTPLGDARAHFVINQGQGYHLQWVCALDDNGEMWTFDNPQVRRQTSISDGFTSVSAFADRDYALFPWADKGYYDNTTDGNDTA